MKKLLIAGGAVVVGAVVARRCASRCGGIDFEQMIERMPENAPPKWMFRNITAIRDNTDRMLQLLEQEHTPPGEPALTPH
jgi:hypothetical protein